MAAADIRLSDLERAAASQSPDFAALVVRYSRQADPRPGAPDESGQPTARPPADAWTVDRLRAALHPNNLDGKDEDEQKALRRQAWDSLTSSPWAPERLKLADLLIALYEEPDAWARNALLEVIGGARIRWGVWRAFKTIYKEAEARHDAEMFGALACRLELASQWNSNVDRSEVTGATTGYLRRRAWRYLRLLGQSVPELYPEMAVQVLRHYPRDFALNTTWVANQIFAHKRLWGARSAWLNALPKLDDRAFDEAWKLSAAPLLFLLEAAENDRVCEFAIKGLERDFAEELRKVDVTWLARIGKKRLATTDGLVVGLLEASPEFHQSKLRSLGLHDMVVGFLSSQDEAVATYAVEYVKAHEPNLDVDQLITLASGNVRAKVAGLVKARLEALAPEKFGLTRLFRMLGIGSIATIAQKKIHDGYAPKDIDEETFVAGYAGGQGAFLDKFFSDAKKAVPTAYLVRVTERPRLGRHILRKVLVELSQRPGTEIGMDWFKRALFAQPTAQMAANWLRQGKLRGADLDVDWLKDLTRRPTMRALALSLLGNRDYVSTAAVGAPWLLTLLTRADPALSDFARGYLLSSFGPSDFDGGVAGIWALTSARDDKSKKRPEAVRAFAFDWLRMHHPELGPTLAEARSLGVEPKATFEVYGFAHVRPLLSDASPAARVFAADIAQHEMLRWNDADVPYLMADSRHPETRKAGVAALLSIGKPNVDVALPEEWLSGERVFAMAESRAKATRELALTLIREHYDRIGGADKLAWLMESPEREVRLFAVRLLWAKHRPASRAGDERERFDSVEALRQFLRAVLFGLPPGRMERREGGAVDRPMKSGVAKRALIEIVRDMGVADADFAAVITPVLGELVHSEAKGEWQACVGALARLRSAHPELAVELPVGTVEGRPRLEPRGFR